MYIQRYKIFENVRQAKKFLDDNDIDYNNKDYLQLKNILSSNLGYLGKFTEWLFKDNTITFLEDIYKMIKNVGLDKDINSFETAEDLYDYLTDKKFNTKVNQIINSLPSRSRNLVNQDLKDLIKNNIDNSNSIKDFYSKKGGRYKNIKDLIKDTKSLILNLQGEWNPESIDYKEGELIYKDSNTLILWIDDYNRSCDLGSKHWCISTSEDMFKGYTKGFKKQYFIYDFTKDISDKKSMIGATIDMNGKPTDIHYKDDTSGKRGDILPYMNYLKPYSQGYIKSKIDVDNIGEVSEYGLIDEVKRLLDQGVDPTDGNNNAIISASTNGHTEVVKLLLQDERVDPTTYDNHAIRMASIDGYTQVVKLLLQDERVDPSDGNNNAIRMASTNGHTDIVKLLLQDERVDPTTYDNHAIRMSTQNGHTDVVKLLLQDQRADPGDMDNYAIIGASEKGHTDIVKLLLQDERVDPSDGNNYAIRIASNNGHTEVVKLLLQDERVDPSDNNNHAIRMASSNGHTDIVELLLQDERVDPSVNNNIVIKMASNNGHIDTVKLLLQDERVREKLTLAVNRRVKSQIEKYNKK